MLFGTNGASETLPKGALVIMSVTMTPAQMRGFADRLAGSRPRVPRIDLVQCYDEAIISYRQTRDALKTPASGPRA